MSLREPIAVACKSVIYVFILVLFVCCVFFVCLFVIFFIGEYIGYIVNSIFPCVHQIKLHCCLCWKRDSPFSPPPLPVTGFVLYCREFSVSSVFSFILLASKREQLRGSSFNSLLQFGLVFPVVSQAHRQCCLREALSIFVLLQPVSHFFKS